MKEVKRGMGRREVRFMEEEREWVLPGLLYADDLILCVESEIHICIYLFYYGLTSLCDPLVDTLISYHRLGHV